MYNTQAIEKIASYIKDQHGVNLAFCVCDNSKFNEVVRAFKNGEISLDCAATKALSTVTKQP